MYFYNIFSKTILAETYRFQNFQKKSGKKKRNWSVVDSNLPKNLLTYL